MSAPSRACRQRGSRFNNIKNLPATSLAPPTKSHEEFMLAVSSGDDALLEGIVGKKGDAHPRFLLFYTGADSSVRLHICLAAVENNTRINTCRNQA